MKIVKTFFHKSLFLLLRFFWSFVSNKNSTQKLSLEKFLVFFLLFIQAHFSNAADISITSLVSTPQTFSGDNQKLLISSGGSLEVDTVSTGSTAILDSSRSGLQIEVDSGDIAKGIIASGGSGGAIGFTGTGNLSSLLLNSGIITSDLANGGTITLSGGGTTNVTTLANTIISNTATSGTAINSKNNGANANLTINNAGTISVNNHINSKIITFTDGSGGSSITVNNSGTMDAGSNGTMIESLNSGNVIDINNSGNITGAINVTSSDVDIINNSGSINGNISLGSNSSSSITINGGTITGNILMADDQTQIVNFNGGSLIGNIDGGALAVLKANKNLTLNGNIGQSSALFILKLEDGATLDAATNNNSINSGTIILSAGSVLNIATNSISGLTRGNADNQGIVNFTQDYTLQSDFGITSTSARSLERISVSAGKTLTAQNRTLDAQTISLGLDSNLIISNGTLLGVVQGESDGVGNLTFASSRILNSDVGTSANSLNSLNVGEGRTIIVGDNSIYANTISLNLSSLLTVGNGTIYGDVIGSSNELGRINFTENNSLNGNLGSSTHALGKVAISDSKTLITGAYNIEAIVVTIGNGATLQLGSGSVLAAISSIEGNSGNGNVAVTKNFTSNYDIGTVANFLSSVVVAEGKTLNIATNNNSLRANNITLENLSTLQIGSGEVNAEILGASNGVGTAIFTQDFTLNKNIGSELNSIAEVTVSNNKTLNSSYGINATNISLGSGATLNMNSGSSINGSLNGSSYGDGNLNIASGTIELTNEVGVTNPISSVTIASGATLNLANNINAADVVASGTLNFGDSSRTINANVSTNGSAIINFGAAQQIISQSFTTISGDIISLTINSTSSSGKLSVGGAANISDATKLNVNIDNSISLSSGLTYEILNGQSGSSINKISDISINGGANKIGNLAFETATSGDSLLLKVLSASSFVDSVIDKNGKNAAYVLEDIGASASGNLYQFQQYINSATPSQIDEAFKTTTPQIDNSINSIFSGIASINTVENRLQFLHIKNNPDNSKQKKMWVNGFYNPINKNNLKGVNEYNLGSLSNRSDGLWIQGFGTSTRQDSIRNIDGYSSNSFGTVIGIDKQISTDASIGVSASFAKSNIQSKTSGKYTNVDNYQLNIYGGKNFNNFMINAIIGVAQNQYLSTRTIPSVNAIAQSEYGGQTYLAKVETAYDKKISKHFGLTPFLSLNFAQNRIDDYQETGAGTMNLEVKNHQTNFFESRIGSALWHNIKTADNKIINSKIKVSYGYNFLKTRQTSDSNFVSQSASFQSNSANVYQGSWKIGAGIDIAKNNSVVLSAEYIFESRKNYQTNFGMISLRHNY